MAAECNLITSGVKEKDIQISQELEQRHPTVAELLIQIESKLYKSIEHRASLLITVWTCLAGKVGSFNDIEKVFHMLYRESAMMTFSSHWHKVSTHYKHGLARSIGQFSVTMGRRVNGSETLCTALIVTIYDPWGDPVFPHLITSEQINKEMVSQFINSEPFELLQIRVECLVAAHLDDAATRLCRCCLEKIQDLSSQRDADNNWRWTFTEWMMWLLFKGGKLYELVAESAVCSCHDGVRLIYQTHRSQKEGAEALTETLINLFLVRDLLFQSSYCCTNELMTLWCDYQIQKQSSISEIQEAARKLLVGHASTSAHFYLFVDILWGKFNISLLPLYLEFYIRGLTSDLNYLEMARQADNKESVIEIENHIAGMYFKLSSMFSSVSKEIALECMLSAFSLDPSQERLELIKKLFLQISKEKALKAAAACDDKLLFGKNRMYNCAHPNSVKRKSVVMCDQAIQVGDDLICNGEQKPVVPDNVAPARKNLIFKQSLNDDKTNEIVSCPQTSCTDVEKTPKMCLENGLDCDSSENLNQDSLIAENPHILAKVDSESISLKKVYDSNGLQNGVLSLSEIKINSCETGCADSNSAKLPHLESNSSCNNDSNCKPLTAQNDSNKKPKTDVNNINHNHEISPEEFVSQIIEREKKALEIASLSSKGKETNTISHSKKHVDLNNAIKSGCQNSEATKDPIELVSSDNKAISVIVSICQSPASNNEKTDLETKVNAVENTICCVNSLDCEENENKSTEENSAMVPSINGTSIEDVTISQDLHNLKNAETLPSTNECEESLNDESKKIFSDGTILKAQADSKVNQRKSSRIHQPFTHVILDCEIPGISCKMLLDFVIVLESLRNKQLKTSTKWSELKHLCEEYLETVSDERYAMLNMQLNGSVDSEADSISEMTWGNNAFESHQSDESVFEDHNIDKGHVLNRFMNSNNSTDLNAYINLSDIHVPQIPLEKLFYTDHSSSRLGHKKRHKRHRNHEKNPEKAALKKLRHVSKADRDLIKRKKRKRRKGRKEKAHTKKHHFSHGKISKDYLKNKKRKKRLKKKKEANSGFISGDYCSDFSSEELMRLVKEHSNSFSKLPTPPLKHSHVTAIVPYAGPSGVASDTSDEPAKKKRKQVSFDKKGKEVKHHDKHKRQKSKPSQKSKKIVIEECSSQHKNMTSTENHLQQNMNDYSRYVQISSVKKMEAVQIRQSSVSLNLSDMSNINSSDVQCKSPLADKTVSDPQLLLQSDFDKYSAEDIMKLRLLMAAQTPDSTSVHNRNAFSKDLMTSGNQSVLKYVCSKMTSHLLSVAQGSKCMVKPDSKLNTSVGLLPDQSTQLQSSSSVFSLPQNLNQNVKHVIIESNSVPYNLMNNSSVPSGTYIPVSSFSSPTTTETSCKSLMGTVISSNACYPTASSPQVTAFTIPIAHNIQDGSGNKLVTGKLVIPLNPCSSIRTSTPAPLVESDVSGQSHSGMIIVKNGNNTQILTSQPLQRRAIPKIKSVPKIVPCVVKDKVTMLKHVPKINKNIPRRTLQAPVKRPTQISPSQPATSVSNTAKLQTTIDKPIELSVNLECQIVKEIEVSKETEKDSTVEAIKTETTVPIPSEIPVAVTSEVPVVGTSKVPVAVTSKIPVDVANKVPVTVTSKVPVAVTSKVPVAVTSNIPVDVANKVTVAVTSEVPVAVTSEVPVASRSVTDSAETSSKIVEISIDKDLVMEVSDEDNKTIENTTPKSPHVSSSPPPINEICTASATEDNSSSANSPKAVNENDKVGDKTEEKLEDKTNVFVIEDKITEEDNMKADAKVVEEADKVDEKEPTVTEETDILANDDMKTSSPHSLVSVSDPNNDDSPRPESPVTSISVAIAICANSPSSVTKSTTEQPKELQPITIGGISSAVKVPAKVGCQSKSEGITLISEVPTRSFTSISDAVRFSLMDMDDATGSVENQVLQSFQTSHESPRDSPSFDNHVTSTVCETSTTTLTTTVLTTPQASNSEINVSTISESFEVHNSQKEKFSECQSSLSRTTTWILDDSTGNESTTSRLLQKSSDIDSATESKEEDRPKKKRKKKERSERDAESAHKFWCEICHRGFFSAYNLRRHCRNVHKMDLPKGTTDLPFSSPSSQCHSVTPSEHASDVTPRPISFPSVPQTGLNQKVSDYALQSPTLEAKSQEFALTSPPSQHSTPIKNTPPDFQLQSPSGMASQATSTHTPAITPTKDFRLQTPSTPTQMPQSKLPVATKSTAKFQRLPTPCASPQVSPVPKLGQMHQQVPLCGQPAVQQSRQLTQIPTSGLVQPIPGVSCQAQQIQQASQCPHFQGNKPTAAQQRISQQIQIMQHVGQIPQLHHVSHTHVTPKVNPTQSFKKCSTSQHGTKISETEQMQQQAAQILQNQQILANQQMQKLVQLRQSALAASGITSQTVVSEAQAAALKSQFFQSQLVASRQAAASGQLQSNQRSQGASYGMQAHTASGHQFFSPAIQQSSDQVSCPHSAFSAQSMAEFTTGQNYPTIRLSSETNDGLEDLEQFLLENMPWSEQTASHHLAHQSTNRPSSTDSLTLTVPSQAAGMGLHRTSAAAKNKTTISRPKPRKPTLPQCSKNLLGNLGRGVKKKPCPKKNPKLSDVGCSAPKLNVLNQASTVIQQSSLNINPNIYNAQIVNSSEDKQTGCNLMANKLPSKSPQSCIVNENDSYSSDSVQCIKITKSQPKEISTSVGVDFNIFSQEQDNSNKYLSNCSPHKNVNSSCNINSSGSTTAISFLDPCNLASENCPGSEANKSLFESVNSRNCATNTRISHGCGSGVVSLALNNSSPHCAPKNSPAVFLGIQNDESKYRLETNNPLYSEKSDILTFEKTKVTSSECAFLPSETAVSIDTEIKSQTDLFLGGSKGGAFPDKNNNDVDQNTQSITYSTNAKASPNNVDYVLVQDGDKENSESVPFSEKEKENCLTELVRTTNGIELNKPLIETQSDTTPKLNSSSNTLELAINKNTVESVSTKSCSENHAKEKVGDLLKANSTVDEPPSHIGLNFNLPATGISIPDLVSNDLVLVENSSQKVSNMDEFASVALQPKETNLLKECSHNTSLCDKITAGNSAALEKYTDPIESCDAVVRNGADEGSSHLNVILNDENKFPLKNNVERHDEDKNAVRIALRIRKSADGVNRVHIDPDKNSKYSPSQLSAENGNILLKKSNQKKKKTKQKSEGDIELINKDVSNNITSKLVSLSDVNFPCENSQIVEKPPKITCEKLNQDIIIKKPCFVDSHKVKTAEDIHKNGNESVSINAEKTDVPGNDDLHKGRSRLRGTPKTSVKRMCPCCVNSHIQKRCGKPNKNKTLKTRNANGHNAKVNTRSSQRLRSRNTPS